LLRSVNFLPIFSSSTVVRKVNISRSIEIAANVLIIGVALFLAYTVFYRSVSEPAQSGKRLPDSSAEIGKKINLPDVSWTGEKRTLIFVLQAGCRFCTESMPFYQQLVKSATENGVRVIAIFPGSREEGVSYLAKHGLTNIDVRQRLLPELNVRGTPTLIMVNGDGEITDTWVGLLPPEKQKSVVDRIIS
jgi:thioredoxin-related protein